MRTIYIGQVTRRDHDRHTRNLRGGPLKACVALIYTREAPSTQQSTAEIIVDEASLETLLDALAEGPYRIFSPPRDRQKTPEAEGAGEHVTVVTDFSPRPLQQDGIEVYVLHPLHRSDRDRFEALYGIRKKGNRP